ncbi:MAG: histidine triad nucleotide-binding protein [Candidatus Electrothrix sp. AW2]|jgi:histidine triad (HIT) family protein|nr:histidine triad nucleotide-binding protein [Candidatus Electrothrix gigas]MCI5135376.1 histidine triad nucleotide-binding protein [Candidatus Electrothrix gigas]MCI5180417.1 histidine triad nucleotide-binding protein [Candidatus Electrothrix gigas]MCI5181589.1 histidine triad nucleotide-binding protein [Candidatus Electrothrix gigas]MCI5190368.1 histidine triad nucleotide-binding protein [Candidatus Electrothrix gigas]
MAQDCLFCKIIQGDIPADTLYEDDEVLAFRDIAPAAPIHFLVIPKKHLSGPSAVTEEDEQLMGKLLRIGNQVAQQEGIEQFRLVFNSGAEAGQTVFHIHMHVLGGRSLNWPPG